MIVSFNSLGKLGRLGNQLFQIAAASGLAEKHGTIPTLPLTPLSKYFDINCYWGTANVPDYKEPEYHYVEPVLSEPGVNLHGYFQSCKYFGTKPIGFKDDFLQAQQVKLPAGENICIHIRRGDYVGHSEYIQLPVTWFILAILSIPDWQTKNLIFISDDMAYCRTHFECLPNAHFIKGTDAEHMALGSLCDYHILSNSSFSWWTAYLADQRLRGSKKVLYPARYFRGAYSTKSTKDLWPLHWQAFWPEDQRLDLGDITFTIPVTLDHNDRKKNLDLSLCHLQKYIKAQYHVGECKGQNFEYMSQYAKYTHFDYSEFHRTKMLNQMAEMATTPYIANWDCDIFLPPMQLWLTAEVLRAGGKMVYPYDGRFARMDRSPWFNRIESQVDIGMVGDASLSRRDIKESVGGAVLWNKQSYIEYGMENEYMVSYAPEDVERYERAFKLGCKIDKVGGVLYHMDHFKGPDSHNGNPNFAISKGLLESYRRMTADELRVEVDKWPWRHQYSASYYERIAEGSRRSALAVYKQLFRKGFLSGVVTYSGEPWPRVIDIGCGTGAWAVGNPNYLGIDFGIPEKSLLIPQKQYRDIDLANATDLRHSEKYELCLCLEVAEHLPQTFADTLISYLCSLSDTVLFSAAIPGQGGTGHINEQWQTYWAEKFKANGFDAALLYPVKNNPAVEMWYRQNLILYKRGATERAYDFVLPEYYSRILQHRENQIQEMRDQCNYLRKKLERYAG